MNYRRIGRWAAAAAGVAVAGAGLWWLKERRVERPGYDLLERDGEIELRRYAALATAETVQIGARDKALGSGFGVLADYIFAGSREGPEIAMTVPVLHEREGARWRVRFLMPAGQDAATLPAATPDVVLGTLPARRLAALSFAGAASDRLLADKETALRGWAAARGLEADGPAQYAFYNSPFLPGPLRRNEVWLAVTGE